MIEDRLTRDIEVGAIARPRFSTEVVSTDGGHEVRNSRWAYPLHRFEFNCAPNLRDSDEYRALRDLWYAAGGDFESFRFRHWADYEGFDEAMEAIEGSTTQFQLMRNYTRGAVTRTRKISRPVEDTVVVYVAGVQQMAGFAVDYDTGIVTFGAPPAQTPTADFEFDVPVRFMDNEIDLVGRAKDLEQPVSISLIEIRE